MLICTNLTTDFYIMSIPLPMVWNARISPTKKAGLCVMFCGGLITAVFGGLRCGFVLSDRPDGPQLAGEWSCRESFVAVFVTNFPVLFPVVHRACRQRFHNGFFGSSYGSSANKGKDGKGGGTPGNSRSGSVGFKLSTISKRENKKGKFKHPLSLPADSFFTRLDGSEEDMIEGGGNGSTAPETEGRGGGVGVVPSIPEDEDIKVTTEWHVQASQPIDAESMERERRDLERGFHAP